MQHAGEVPLTFLKQYTRFESRAETREPAEKVVSMPIFAGSLFPFLFITIAFY